MQTSILEDRVVATDFSLLAGVARNFAQVYSRMLDFARANPVDGVKRKTERFPKAIADIIEQVTQSDYGILNPQAEEPVKMEREYLFVMFLCAHVDVYGASALFPYRTIDDMIATNPNYESFRDRSSEEQAQLVTYANWMQLAMRFRRPNANKGSLLVSIPIAAEKRNHARYITGTGATRPTKDRIGVYEVEGQTTPAPRPNRKREDDWTGSPAPKATTSASRGSATSTPSSSIASNSRSAPRRVKSDKSRDSHGSPLPATDDELLERIQRNSPSPQTPKAKVKQEASQDFELPANGTTPAAAGGAGDDDEAVDWNFDESLLDALEKDQTSEYVPSYASQLLQETKLVGDFVLEDEDDVALAALVEKWGLQTAHDIQRLYEFESQQQP